MSVTRISLTHLLDCVGEQIRTGKDARIFSEEAEDQSRHEVIHVFSAFACRPIRVVREELHIETRAYWIQQYDAVYDGKFLQNLSPFPLHEEEMRRRL